jgi:hypothetical protein
MARWIANLFAWMLPAGLYAASMCGCASWFEAGPPPVNPQLEPIGKQLEQRVPSLRAQRFSTLLDFEMDADGVFVAMSPPGRMVWDRSHTGRRSLLIAPGTSRVAIKLSSVLSGRQFPGEWTLVGAFLYCDEPIDVTIAVEGDDLNDLNVPPRRVQLSSATWSIALADLSNVPHSETANIADNTRLVITLPPNAPAVWCDDVLLINNTRAIVSGATSEARAPDDPMLSATASVSEEYTATRIGNAPPIIAPAPPTTAATPDDAPAWSIQERGLSYVAQRPGRFNFKLLTAEASRSGWQIEEANPIRARFVSNGKTKHLTVYSDGRSFWDGELKPMSADVRDDRGCTEPHKSPAEIQINAERGRLNRNTPGDANNDGYNEQRGAYQLVADGARLELTIIPHTSWITRPVFEISGLPPGNLLVTIEGRLIEPGIRLADGSLLLELPVRIDRPTAMYLRLQ